jgi:hypothetical protein
MKFLSSRSKIIQHHNNFKKAEVMFSQTKRDPLSTPLNKAPPGHQPCAPTLLLGLPSWVAAELGHVLRNDLAFGLTSKWYWAVPLDVKLTFLEFVNGESLIQMTKAFGGSILMCEDELYSSDDGKLQVNRFLHLQKDDYQAIITDDTSMIRERPIAAFVSDMHHRRGVSVVIMAIEGIFNLSPLRQLFGVDWKLTAYTKRTVQLTRLGQRVLSEDSFPFQDKYCKAHFIEGRGALLSEYVNPSDYEASDSDCMNDPVPDPSPGSPVVMVTQGDRSVSYFGFVNPLDVPYGAIILRLCYASYHESGQTAPIPRVQTKKGGDESGNSSTKVPIRIQIEKEGGENWVISGNNLILAFAAALVAIFLALSVSSTIS